MRAAKWMVLLLAVAASSLGTSGPQEAGPARRSTGLRGPYLGQDPPGEAPRIFAPGVVSTPDENEFCASFSADGKEFYFNRGMTIMVCRWESDGWTAPEPAPFTSGYRSHEAHLAFDNRRLFFGGSRPPQPYGIWLTTRTSSGWSEPRRLWDGMYATSAKSGNVYFGVEGASGAGIVRARLVDGRYAEPEPQTICLGGPDRKSASFFHPGIAPDESFIVFDDNKGLYVSFREDDGSWGNAVPLSGVLGDRMATIPSLSPDGAYLFFAWGGDLHWIDARILERARRRSKDQRAWNVSFTVFYDNLSADDEFVADHGFSCLVELEDRTYLFDAGRRPDKLTANMRALGVDRSKIDQVIISHIHDDHMGAIFELLTACDKPSLCLPFSYPCSAAEPHTDRSDADYHALLERLRPSVSAIVQKKEGGRIGEGIWTTGMIEDQSYEQALIVQTPKGLAVLTGCAHPGILEIVRRARELLNEDVYLVLGGFHLASADPAQVRAIARELRTMTKLVGPCHCTGEAAQAIFKDIFGDDYIAIGAGMKVSLNDARDRAEMPRSLDLLRH